MPLASENFSPRNAVITYREGWLLSQPRHDRRWPTASPCCTAVLRGSRWRIPGFVLQGRDVSGQANPTERVGTTTIGTNKGTMQKQGGVGCTSSDNGSGELTLDNRVHGTSLLTEAAIDTLSHVDICTSAAANAVGSACRTRTARQEKTNRSALSFATRPHEARSQS